MKSEKKGKTVNINIGNDLTEDHSRDFINLMKSFISEDMKRFNLDFKSVLYVDSYTLSNLIVFGDKSDLEFTFKNVTKPLMNVFEIIKLNKLVHFE